MASPNGLWLWVLAVSCTPHWTLWRAFCRRQHCRVLGSLGSCPPKSKEAWCCLGLDCKRDAAAPGAAATRQQRASVPSVTLFCPQAVCLLIDEVSPCLSPQRLFQVWLGYKARSCLEKGKGPQLPGGAVAPLAGRGRTSGQLAHCRLPASGLAHSCMEALAAVPFFQEG